MLAPPGRKVQGYRHLQPELSPFWTEAEQKNQAGLSKGLEQGTKILFLVGAV